MRRRLPYVWGATPEEVAASYPGEQHVPPGSVRMIRAVDTTADRHELFTWLCQMRRAPYSYDLIDNRGRRSPRTADPALRELAAGQRIAKIFTVVDFVEDDSITMRLRPGSMFGDLVMTYAIREGAAGRRLVGVLELPHRSGVRPAVNRWLLGWGDLVMMRKQLRTLTGLAERSSR